MSRSPSSGRFGRLGERVALRAQLALGVTAVFSALEALNERLDSLRTASEEFTERLRSVSEGFDERLRSVSEGFDERLRTTSEAVSEQLHAIDERLESTSEALEAARERARVLDGRLRAETTRIHVLESRLAEVLTEHRSLQTALAAVEELVSAAHSRPSMWGFALEPFLDEVAGGVYGFRGGASEPASQDELYHGVLEVFRAPPGVVQDGQRPYLELIGDRAPVVEIGCGRGDFLDLLRERDTSYVGVDPDPGMFAAARARGNSDLVQTDANTYLESVPGSSVGAVVCSYVIEHMAADYLVRFMELSLEKLKPGGIFIAETPNPHSAHASKAFWADITRRGPVFPELALTLCWRLGFGSAYVFHPGGSGDAEKDRFVEREFALVATKAGAADEAGARPVESRPQ